MTIFASISPTDFNVDYEPYLATTMVTGRQERFGTRAAARDWAGSAGSVIFDPRENPHAHDWADGVCYAPDCAAHVPVHPANPILVAYRKAIHDPNGYVRGGDLSKIDNWMPKGVTPQQIEHASRVVIRLVSFDRTV